MKKANRKARRAQIAAFSALLFSASMTIVACGTNQTPVYHADFDFFAQLSNGNTFIYLDETDVSVIVREINSGKVERNYTFSVAENDYLTVNALNGKITLKGVATPGTDRVPIRVYEENSDEWRTCFVSVRNRSTQATGGYNFASNSTARTEILGKLEDYAMNNFLTGISLFENGGWVRYSPRITLPVDNYIPGYGFGILSEGEVSDSDNWLNKDILKYRDYYRSASSSDPLNINAWDASGSQIADLNGYISSSYWGTKIDPEDSSKYVWYSILADDDCTDPQAVTVSVDPETHKKTYTAKSVEDSKTGSYKTWRVYVKADNPKVKFHAADGASATFKSKYDDKMVRLEDYEFVFKMLLTGGTKLKRGAELATDTSYGFKGAISYYNSTKNITGARGEDDYEAVEAAWKAFKEGGGFQTSADIEGDGYTGKPYLQFELINPIDQFNAKYTLSSNLYTPMREDFMTEIGGSKGWIAGAKNFGSFDGDNIANRVLCLGPYRLQLWTKLQETVFARNTDWFEYDVEDLTTRRYKIPGVHIRVFTDATSSTEAMFNHFSRHEVDSVGLPSSVTPGSGNDYQTVGDSTFKLNVNSCTQDRWNELFGSDGKIVPSKDDDYKVNVAMSNNNFLRGLFWSINRKEFADHRHVEASYNYFANTYMSDAVNGKPYNETEAHKKALLSFGIDKTKTDNANKYGYDPDKAKDYFRAALSELTSSDSGLAYGTAANPTKITIRIEWMNPTDEIEYGQNIANYFKATFNDPNVCGRRIILDVTHHNEASWEKVYSEHLQIGRFDLGFGAISGNSLNPLNFMEVLKSDNSSGFTLNWGADTSTVNPAYPIIYDNEEWTYDSLWAAADHGAVVSGAKTEDIVQKGFIQSTKRDGTIVDNLVGGATITTKLEFLDVGDTVATEIDQIQLYLVGGGILVIDPSEWSYDKTQGILTLNLSAETINTANKRIYDGSKSLQRAYEKLDPTAPDYETEVAKIKEKLRMQYYASVLSYGEQWWEIEVVYNVRIGSNEETSATYSVLKSENEKKDRSPYRLAR